LNGWYGTYYGQGPASSPLAHVRPDAPPFFIAHGDRFGSLRFERVVDAIEAFTAWVRSSTARPDHDLRLER
jgi:hypothetical protein